MFFGYESRHLVNFTPFLFVLFADFAGLLDYLALELACLPFFFIRLFQV